MRSHAIAAMFALVTSIALVDSVEAQTTSAKNDLVEMKALRSEEARFAAPLKEFDEVTKLIADAQFAEAEKLTGSLIADIDQRGGRNSVTAAYMLTLAGVCAEAQGHFAQEQDDLERALAIRRAHFGFSPGTAVAYMALANNQRLQGRFAESEDLLLNAIQITIAIEGRSSPALPPMLSSLAIALSGAGQLEDASGVILEAELAEDPGGTKIPRGDVMAKIYNNAGTIELARGRYSIAVSDLQLAMQKAAQNGGDPDNLEDDPIVAAVPRMRAYFKGDPADLPIILLNLTSAQIQDRQTTTAIETLRRTIPLIASDRIYKSLKPSYTATLATALSRNAYDTGSEPARSIQYDESNQLFENAIADLQSSEGGSSRSVALLTFEYGFETFRRAQLDRYKPQAIAELKKGEALSYAGVNALSHWHALGESVDINMPTSQLSEDVTGEDPDFGSPYQKYLNIAYYTAHEDRSYSLTARDRAFEIAQEAIRSPAAREMAASQARRLAPAGPISAMIAQRETLIEQIHGLDSQIRRPAKNALAGQAAALIDSREHALTDLAAVERELATRFPQYAALIASPTIALADVQKVLAPDEGLLLILPGRQQGTMSFGVSRDQVAWNFAEEPSPLYRYASKIDAAIETLHASVAPGRAGLNVEAAHPVDFKRAAAFELYKAVIQPVEGALGGVKRLYVVTAGSLSDIPLGLLTTQAPRAGSGDSLEALAADQSWFGDKYAITYLPSVANLILAHASTVKERLGGTTPFDGYGAPQLDGTPSDARGPDPAAAPLAIADFEQGVTTVDPKWLRKAFHPLLSAEFELQRMAQTLGADTASIHMAKDATETALKTDPMLLHAQTIAFATHGVLPGEVSGVIEPGLVLTPPVKATAMDDGLLTASEVAGLRLSADWVILSACNTATADGVRGEQGLSTLARAFLYAGADALLASHWSVDDGATLALMTETLAARRDNPKLSHAEALQQAMHTVRTGRRPDGSRVLGYKLN